MSNNGGPRTQLWKEEHEIIAEFAASVPSGGTIVEIGTAEGGTSLLMSRAVNGKDVHIYTVDIAPAPRAFDYLKDTGVTMIVQPSVEGARQWKRTINRPIDFLFIDGNHDLEHLVDDWNLWSPYVKDGGLVAFHDYDPPERGGVSHFAVRVGVETIMRSSSLATQEHRYKIGSGIMHSSRRQSIAPSDCLATLAGIGEEIVRIKDADYSNACIIADERLASLLKGCLKAENGFEVISVDQACDPNKIYLVRAQPNGESLAALRNGNIPDLHITALDSLTICYLVADALKMNYSYLAEHTLLFKEFLIWAEALSMFEHAFEESVFPHFAPALFKDVDIHGLSQLVAREQVRILLLTRILRTFVDWVP